MQDEERFFEALEKIAKIYADGLTSGVDQEYVFDTVRDGFVRLGFPPRSAANMTRVIIQIAAKMLDAPAVFNDDDMKTIISLI